MNFNAPFFPAYNGYRAADMKTTYKTLDEALTLVKQAVQDEREDELFYDYLLSVAPTQEEKDIITSIRDDEKKHNKYFREIYAFFTGQSIPAPTNVDFQKPASYIDGIKKAKFGELAAMERYRIIRAGIPNEYYRDMVFEILTDELKHAHKYDYILYLSLANKREDNTMGFRIAVSTFTQQEVIETANKLQIDFSKEKFDINQFTLGLNTEVEHEKKYYPTKITEDDSIDTAKITLAHLREYPDYYTRLAKLEEEAETYWHNVQ